MTVFAPKSIGIVGLGYVGLPLATLLATKFSVVGYDVNAKRIDALRNFVDHTNEVDSSVLKDLCADGNSLQLTKDPEALENCDFYIVTVPTPVSSQNIPDLSFLKRLVRQLRRFSIKGMLWYLSQRSILV